MFSKFYKFLIYIYIALCYFWYFFLEEGWSLVVIVIIFKLPQII